MYVRSSFNKFPDFFVQAFKIVVDSSKFTMLFLYIYYLPTPPLGQDMTQGQFLSGVQQVWIQSFPSPRLVASPRLKNLVYPTIYPWRENNWIHTFPKGVSAIWNAISLVQDLTRVAVSISNVDNDYTTGTSTILFLSILWDDWQILMISDSNEQLQQQLEYTLLKPDCHSWWISKMQSRREDTLKVLCLEKEFRKIVYVLPGAHFFVWAFKINYVIAIHLMRWLTNF